MLKDRDYWRRTYAGMIFAQRHGKFALAQNVTAAEYKEVFELAEDLVTVAENFETSLKVGQVKEALNGRR